MDKIAIISDIHGNLEALKAVLQDIKNRGITEIYCLGDIICKGVHSMECIELIKKSCKVVLQGNCDDYFTKEHDLSKIEDKTEKDRIRWMRNTLSDEDRNYLQSLPISYEFYLSGRLVRIFHASPNSAYDTCGLFADINEKNNLFLPSDKTMSQNKADMVVYGHLHIQLLNQAYNRTLLNCGSVGNSLDYLHNDSKDGNVNNTTNAQYLILEGIFGSVNYDDPISFQFIRVPYDIEEELSADLFNPEKESYINELTKSVYCDIEKVYLNFERNGVDISKI